MKLSTADALNVGGASARRPDQGRWIHQPVGARRRLPHSLLPLFSAFCSLSLGLHPLHAEPVHGWLSWRGPQQNGTSVETNLPDKWEIGGKNHLWTYELPSRGTPVIANGKLYVWGYSGEGADLQEVLACLDAETGRKIWEHRFNDFLSDIVYERYSIGAPTIDPETGNVFILTSANVFAAFTADGKKLWEHSLMEEYGKLTFPNGRTGAPVIDGDLVIIHGITSNWGAQGPGADRFYAFDKKTGQIVWSSTPGAPPPKDSSFSTPVLAWQNGKRVLYCGTGDGCIVGLNARTGDPLWHYKFSAGGVNASVVLCGDLAVAGHADENLDSSDSGRMVAVKIGSEPPAGKPGPVALERNAEVWRNRESVITSSPVVVGDVIYQVNKVGELCRMDGKTGKVAWRHKLGPDQLHASPTYADGKLYIPMRDAGFFIVRPTEKAAEVLSHTPLEGEALGAPAIWNGKVYFTTTKRMYCFGARQQRKSVPSSRTPLRERIQKRQARSASGPSTSATYQKRIGLAEGTVGPITQLQVVPCEVLMRSGQKQSFRVRALDANGSFVNELEGGEWKKFIPPTARVKSEMDAEFNENGELVVKPAAGISAGAWEVTVKADDKEFKGYIRGRVLPDLPYREDFEKFEINVAHETEKDAAGAPSKFAWPPLPWIGARFKWEVRELDGNKVMAKTIDNIFFQRAFTWIGDPSFKNYTMEADVMSEGNRRNMSNVGIINQRYVINLVGNWQQLEVVSNQDRVKVCVPFAWQPNVWYRLKSRVDVARDGSGVVRAKAWKRGESEPEKWTIEAPHKHAHTHGAPGFYGFALQSQFRVYVDNIVVKPND